MSHQLPYRGVLTDALVDYAVDHQDLSSASILVGDGLVNEAAGWTGGTPGQGQYVRSATIYTGPAVPASAESLRGRHTNWLCDYTVLITGGARTHTDNGADIVRNVLAGFRDAVPQLEMGDYLWSIKDVFYAQLAPVTADQRTTPATWLVRDTLSIRLERPRTNHGP